MDSISAVLLGLTKANDHVLCSMGLYGSTFSLLKIMEEKYNISHELIEMKTKEEIRACIQPETACIYVETPINPTMQLVDLQDRKSTRLNSSHVAISYAVFCLK